jgi:HlyD family secretion protein
MTLEISTSFAILYILFTMENNIELRSEEVQEIITQMPGGLIRWGIGLIFFLFVVLLSISWFVKYPDVIKAKVVVTTDPAPINLVSRAVGKITLLKKANETARKNDLIAHLQTNASLTDMNYLEAALTSYEANTNTTDLFIALDKNIKAGDLQSYVNATVKSLQDLIAFTETKLHEKQIAHLNKQVVSYKNLNRNLQKQLGLMKQEGALSYQQFKADSILLVQKVIAPLDFNKTKSAYLLQQRGVKSMEASIISNQLQADDLEKQVTELEIGRTKEENQLQTSAENAIKELAARLKAWKENFLFTAPADGTVAYLGFIENDQYIENGKPLFALLPTSNKLIAKAELPVLGSGKVKVGQLVNIRLSNYPFEQFGMLQGEIESISEVPDKENYTVAISLRQGMNSTHNKLLSFRPQLQGETEIITEDLRLLERVFYQFRKLIATK